MRRNNRIIFICAMLLLPAFATTSIVHSKPVSAAIGAVAWPLFPLIIVGAALEGTAIATATGACMHHYGQHHIRPYHLWEGVLGEVLLGLLFLDKEDQNAKLQPVSIEQASQYGLSDAEMLAYNNAVESGTMDAVLQQAAQELSQDSTHNDAKKVMENLLNQLPREAHTAFVKIAQYVLSRS